MSIKETMPYKNIDVNIVGGGNCQKNSNLTSSTISALRLPLAIMVVFIHSFGKPATVDTLTIVYSNIGISEVYDLLRVAISHVITHCAVPTFFLLSGYLFFTKLQEWDFGVWKTKIKSRIYTVLVPYLIWVSIAIAWILLQKTAGCIVKSNPWSGITEWFSDNGWLHLYWDCNTWNLERTNILGWHTPSSAPYLIPFWFMRDLIVVLIFTPVIHWCIKQFKTFFMLLVLICYILGIWFPIPGFSSLATLYFSIGAYLMVNKIDLTAVCRRLLYVFYLVAIVLLPFMIYYDGHNTEIGNRIYPFFVLAMCGSIINIITWLERNSKMAWSKKYSDTTFFIFASHVFFLPYTGKLLRKAVAFMGPLGDIVAYILIPLLTVIICITLCRIMQRYLPKLSKVIGCR